jgi:hypothetical protein
MPVALLVRRDRDYRRFRTASLDAVGAFMRCSSLRFLT